MGISNPHNVSKFDPYLMVPPGNPAGTPWMRGEFTDITLNVVVQTRSDSYRILEVTVRLNSV
jgi:hypothetical protein